MDTENEYLEAMNQLKEKFDKLEDKEKMIKGLIKKLRADMCHLETNKNYLHILNKSNKEFILNTF